MTFGTKLRKYRERRRYSQREIAELLGVSQTTYYNWEADITSCRVKFLAKLAKVLDVDMAELVPDELVDRQSNNNQQRDQAETAVNFENDIADSSKLYTELLLSKDELIRFLKDENTFLKRRNAQLEEWAQAVQAQA